MGADLLDIVKVWGKDTIYSMERMRIVLRT